MKLAEDFSIPYLPDLVREKKWTIDTMNSYVKQVADDLTGDGEMRPVDDRWGLVMGALTSFPTFVIGCGNSVMTNDPQNGLQLSMNTERMVNSIDKVLDLTCDLNYSFFCDDWKGKVDYDHYSTASYTFYANNALFQTTVPYSLKNLSAKCDFDYCILPFPMYDENQDKYYTLPDWTAHLFGIPASCKDPDFAGFMLEALSAASTDTTLKAYYETACKVKYNYVQDSIDMLDTVFDGIVLDPSMVYNIGNIYSIIRENIPSKRKNNFASLYASREPAAQKALDKFKETIKEIQ